MIWWTILTCAQKLTCSQLSHVMSGARQSSFSGVRPGSRLYRFLLEFLNYAVCCLTCGGAIWRTLTKERQAWCCLQVKLCDPCLSALRVCVRTKMALYKYSYFPFFLYRYWVALLLVIGSAIVMGDSPEKKRFDSIRYRKRFHSMSLDAVQLTRSVC